MALYAFDGTWNDSSAPEGERDLKKDTNVHRFRVLYEETHHYVDGVGCRGGVFGKVIGGLTGAGAGARIQEQWEKLRENFEEGDTTIDIVGYSRGSAIARMFVHQIEEAFEGLGTDDRPVDRPPRVRFLGLFDTVASFGVPWGNDEGSFRPDIPEFVQNTFHAMALDETRETFGIERCLGNRKKITEVWFRGGHGDVGGNATYLGRNGEEANLLRSDIALNWMVSKARACGLPLQPTTEAPTGDDQNDAPITAKDERISIGDAGTLSRRIHLGDLVHYTLERTDLTRGLDGRLLRRLEVATRIEDQTLESRAKALHWVPAAEATVDPPQVGLSIVELSSRRYPFDVPPARTWAAWLDRWDLKDASEGPDSEFGQERLDLFWAPTPADLELAWDLIVELKTRITTQELQRDEGDDVTALTSVANLFKLSREFFHRHGRSCNNSATLITFFLNKHVRPFTASWHLRSVQGELDGSEPAHTEFREELELLQPRLKALTSALEDLADIRL